MGDGSGAAASGIKVYFYLKGMSAATAMVLPMSRDTTVGAFKSRCLSC